MENEDEENQQIEEFYDADTHVSEWVDVYFKGKDGISEINRTELARFFEGCGAKEPTPELRGDLKFDNYNNASRSKVMKAIWGDHYKEFKDFCDEYVAEYEKELGEELPKVKFTHKDKPPTFSKTEGMRGLFADLTALAFAEKDEYKQENFGLVTSARLASSHARDRGNWKKENYQIIIPGYNKNRETGIEVPFAPASFQPDFPEKALNQIRSWNRIG